MAVGVGRGRSRPVAARAEVPAGSTPVRLQVSALDADNSSTSKATGPNYDHAGNHPSTSVCRNHRLVTGIPGCVRPGSMPASFSRELDAGTTTTKNHKRNRTVPALTIAISASMLRATVLRRFRLSLASARV
jgi:hypothetical protein